MVMSDNADREVRKIVAALWACQSARQEAISIDASDAEPAVAAENRPFALIAILQWRRLRPAWTTVLCHKGAKAGAAEPALQRRGSRRAD